MEFFRRRESALLSAPGSRKLWRFLNIKFSPRVFVPPIERDDERAYDDLVKSFIFNEYFSSIYELEGG